jgi:hypothetical protein|tara:strand:+ start:1281 stop:1580 length:300 start_codon:yes stop_codon:yes gene_type:complete
MGAVWSVAENGQGFEQGGKGLSAFMTMCLFWCANPQSAGAWPARMGLASGNLSDSELTDSDTRNQKSKTQKTSKLSYGVGNPRRGIGMAGSWWGGCTSR